jgi:hypothetical protein
MTTDLFAEIDAHLARMRERATFQAAMDRAEWEYDLWQSIRPLIRTRSDYRAAAGYMATSSGIHLEKGTDDRH